MWRTHPQALTAQRLIADGAIGQPSVIRTALRVAVGPGDIRRSPSLGGGALGDLGCYCVSAIRLFGGDPVRLTAGAVFEQVDTRLGGVLQCPDGVLDLPRADELDVVASEGALHIPEPWLCTAGEIELTRKGVVERIPADPDVRFALSMTPTASSSTPSSRS